MKIGIMGAKGSFSEEAAQTYAMTERLSGVELVYLVNAERVLTALEEGSIDLAIFPIENSTGGIVIEAVHAMAKHRFQMKTMFGIDIHQNFIVAKGATAEQITAVTSHDQALKQCRSYLERKWPGVEVVEYEDTAKAAADLANGTLPATTAVIASRAAATIYDLDMLEESIQDLHHNVTTFVVAENLGE